LTGYDSQGAHPIGKDCAKNYKDFVFGMNQTCGI
jgi:hypothetical protein